VIQREENIEHKKERHFNYFKLAFFSFFIFLFSIDSIAQDSIPEKEDLTEETELKFQLFFFKALSEKSIGNYQKAIENLESCNQILSNDIAVFFEFSKNYLFLNNTLLAKEYIERALVKEPTNTWMLRHLMQIYLKDNKYAEAIKTQQKIVAINPKEREFLARLYVFNGQIKEAISLINTLEKENVLSSYLKKLRTNLESRKEYSIKKISVDVDLEEVDAVEELNPGKEATSTDISVLKSQFKADKSYIILEAILKKSNDNQTDLLKFSEEGMALFPAQAYVYFVNGKVLNDTKNYKKALTILQSGIDFVIDDKMEAAFYLEIAKAYKGIGNDKEEMKYLQKAKNLKN
jgi:tetratricopeptide (TPR) repeat protein